MPSVFLTYHLAVFRAILFRVIAREEGLHVGWRPHDIGFVNNRLCGLLAFLFLLVGLSATMPGVGVRPPAGDADLGLAYGFRLVSFCHTFTPLLPLVPVYHYLRGDTRSIYPTARDLHVEVFLRDRWNACFRVVCNESKICLV